MRLAFGHMTDHHARRDTAERPARRVELVYIVEGGRAVGMAL